MWKHGEKIWDFEKKYWKLWKIVLEIGEKCGNLVKNLDIWKFFGNFEKFGNVEKELEIFFEIWKKFGNVEKILKFWNLEIWKLEIYYFEFTNIDLNSV